MNTYEVSYKTRHDDVINIYRGKHQSREHAMSYVTYSLNNESDQVSIWDCATLVNDLQDVGVFSTDESN